MELVGLKEEAIIAKEVNKMVDIVAKQIYPEVIVPIVNKTSAPNKNKSTLKMEN